MKPQYADGDSPVVQMPLKGVSAASLQQQLQKKARPHPAHVTKLSYYVACCSHKDIWIRPHFDSAGILGGEGCADRGGRQQGVRYCVLCRR
jgi:hypothetical protein